jgi:hypothetical protein
MIFWILSIILTVICIGGIIIDIFFAGAFNTFFISTAIFAGFFLVISLSMGGFWYQCGKKAEYFNKKYGTDFTQKELFITDNNIIMLKVTEKIIKEEE